MTQIVAEDGAPRLDRFLADRFPEVPRARWDSHVRTGAVKVNGQPVSKGGVKLRPGDVVETELPVIAVPAAHLEAEAIDLPTLFEDAHLWWIVLRKSTTFPWPSVMRPSSRICSSAFQTSGCAFSISSNSTTA